jgi:hypothetical protein
MRYTISISLLVLVISLFPCEVDAEEKSLKNILESAFSTKDHNNKVGREAAALEVQSFCQSLSSKLPRPSPSE